MLSNPPFGVNWEKTQKFIRDKKGNPVPDSDLRDYENIP